MTDQTQIRRDPLVEHAVPLVAKAMFLADDANDLWEYFRDRSTPSGTGSWTTRSARRSSRSRSASRWTRSRAWRRRWRRSGRTTSRRCRGGQRARAPRRWRGSSVHGAVSPGWRPRARRRLDAAQGGVQVVHDRCDRHVHERRVDDQHEHRHRDQDGEPGAAGRLGRFHCDRRPDHRLRATLLRWHGVGGAAEVGGDGIEPPTPCL